MPLQDGRSSCKRLLRAAGRQLLAANATAAASTEPPANILFTVSATRATLTADALRLVNVASVVQFYTSNSNAGVYPTGALACWALCLRQWPDNIVWYAA